MTPVTYVKDRAGVLNFTILNGIYLFLSPLYASFAPGASTNKHKVQPLLYVISFIVQHILVPQTVKLFSFKNKENFTSKHGKLHKLFGWILWLALSRCNTLFLLLQLGFFGESATRCVHLGGTRGPHDQPNNASDRKPDSGDTTIVDFFPELYTTTDEASTSTTTIAGSPREARDTSGKNSSLEAHNLVRKQSSSSQVCLRSRVLSALRCSTLHISILTDGIRE